jgi:hypothetical protein
LKYFRRGFFESSGLREHLCDGVLRHEALLGALALSDVLYCAEHSARPARLVSHHVALTMDQSHFAVGPNDSVLDIVAPATPKRLRHCFDHDLSIFGVNQVPQLG